MCFKAKGIDDLLSPELMKRLNDRQRIILTFLLITDRVSSTQILAGSSLTISDRTLRRYLNELMELGGIQSEGRGPNTVWFLVDHTA